MRRLGRAGTDRGRRRPAPARFPTPPARRPAPRPGVQPGTETYPASSASGHAAPGHLQAATARCGGFDQYVFDHDRAALLAEQLPATSGEHAQAQARHQAHLTAELVRTDTAERGLISELEQPADPADPASQAHRARIRARFTDLYPERTRIEAKLADLEAAAPPDNDPALLDLLPVAAALFTDAPDRIKEALLTAFDIQALYRHDQNQVTI